MVVVVIMVVMMMMMVIWWGPTGTTLVCCRESFTGRSDNRCVKEKKSLLYRNATQKLAMLSASLTIANVEDWSSTSLLILLVLHSLAATNLPLLSNFFLSSHDVRAWLGDKKTNYFSCSLTVSTSQILSANLGICFSCLLNSTRTFVSKLSPHPTYTLPQL